jgi:hypothetical protein
MSNDNKSTNKGGIGFIGLLTIVFIALKLTKSITWPWIWVLAPAWIYILFIIVLLVIVGIATVIDE